MIVSWGAGGTRTHIMDGSPSYTEIHDEAIAGNRRAAAYTLANDTAPSGDWSSDTSAAAHIAFELRDASSGAPKTGLVRVEFS